MEEKRIDCSKQTPEELALAAHHARLIHRFNLTEPYSEEWTTLMQEIFKGMIGEGSRVMQPLMAICPHEVTIGIYACSPEESSFKAVFTDMQITKCAWKAHDGQQADY